MTHARVFPFWARRAAPRLRLVCLPYAGGAASTYREWSRSLAPEIDVVAVELPGRGVRMAEPAVDDLATLCDGLVAAIEPLCDGVPLAVFGHSMGARIGFELAVRLDGRGARSIAHLFASASPAPGVRLRYGKHGDARPSRQLSDDDFLARLAQLGGTPPEILAERDLMARVLPTLRADLAIAESCRVDPSLRVACPITAIAGRDDPGAAASSAAAWQLRTTGAFRLVELAAGHFFLDSHRDAVLREVVRDLALHAPTR
jgi:medium-chain acyl-[acyl-carrier-protein] hydrolase